MTTKINKLLKNLSFGGVLYNWMLFIDFWVYGWILKCGWKCTNVNIQLKVSCLSLWWFNLWVGLPVSTRQHLHVRNESKNVILMTGTEVAKTKLVALWDKAWKVQRPKSLSQRYFGNNSRMWGQWITSTIHIWGLSICVLLQVSQLYFVYCKSSIKPPLSNKPPLFRGRKLLSPPPPLFFTTNLQAVQFKLYGIQFLTFQFGLPFCLGYHFTIYNFCTS